MTELTSRLAVRADVPDLTALMDAAIDELQRAYLDEDQIESSRAIMGIDTQLIDDGTYFVVEADGALAGCGGWSRRATLYGGNQAPGRNSTLLDPSVDPARVRAMYTAPAFARRGVGRLILSLCEAAAAARGLHAPRAHVHSVRRAALRRLRLPAARAARGRNRRRPRAACQDGEGRRGRAPSSALSEARAPRTAPKSACRHVAWAKARRFARSGGMPGVPPRGWKRSTRPPSG